MWNFLKRMLRGRSAELRESRTSLDSALSEQKRAEKSLGHSEEEFAKLVAGVRDYAIFLMDRQGHILTWNSGAEFIKGYRPEEIIGQHFSRFYPKEAVSSGWPAHELEVAAQTGRFEDEGWRIRQDGTRFWANIVITALWDKSGEVRGFLKITRDLTDRKQAEETVRIGEERFRLMVENVEAYAIFMIDPEGLVATWNAGAERIKGYTAEEIIGAHFSRFYPQEAIDQGWPAEELRRAAAKGRFEDEGWRIRKDGSRFWANVVITALRDENGVLRGYGKVTRDLTERKAAEEKARRLLQEEAARKAAEESAREAQRAQEEERRQREELHVTLKSIGDAVIVTDNHGRVTFLNPVAVKLTGWNPEEAAGKLLDDMFHIIHEQTRQPVENPVCKVLEKGVVVGLANHTVLISKDGTEYPIDDSGAPIRGEDGTIAGVVLVFRDVTEARKAMQTRMHMAAIVESSEDAIIGISLTGNVLSWNKGAERLYGYASEEIVGKPLTVLIPENHPDELPEILEQIGRGEMIEHFETERIRKDGGRIDVSLTVSPIKNTEGKVVGASKIARDITARKEAERHKNEFLALLAHELRNPLAPLRNGLEVLRLAGEDPETIAESRAMMERQLEHMVRLVDDLLDLSRIQQGKIELRKERIPLREAVHSALESCQPMIGEQHRNLTVALPDEPVYVEADKTRLAQAVANLLSNAVKYSDAGCSIWLAVRREDGEAVVSVKDTGIGISADMLPKVFEMFIQGDRSLEKSQGGLGVGLSIVKQLVEMHGGRVEARSEGPGRGSEFIIRLPAVAAPLNQQPQVNKGRQLVEKQTRHRILVVDDNVDAAKTMSMMLKIMGNEIRTAHDGLQGIERAEEFRPDMILLDIGMPKLNGYETCRRIREQPWGGRIFIVALTGWGQEEDKRRSHEAGFDYHLVKPVEPATLESLLANLDPEPG